MYSSLSETQFWKMDCPEYSPTDFKNLKLQRTFFSIATWILAGAGILGNALSISVLVKGFSPRRTFHNLLIALAVADASYLLLERLKSTFWSGLMILLPHVMYPGINICLRLSIFLTMTLAVERYKAVSKGQGQKRNRWSNSFWFYLVIAAAAAVAISIPNFFDVRVVEDDLGELALHITEFRKHPEIAFHRNWITTILTALIPVVTLICLNLMIYLKVRTLNKAALSGNQETSKTTKEAALALLLIFIVMLFIMCHTPRLVLNIYEMIVLEDVLSCVRQGRPGYPAWSITMVHLSHLLLVVNSSLNIIVYTSVSAEFRQKFKQILFCQKKGQNSDVEMERIDSQNNDATEAELTRI